MDAIQQEIQFFEELVPRGDEAGMVLKAQLLIEQSLWKFISVRIKNEELLKELQSDQSVVKSGKGLIQLAQALAARDELQVHDSEKLWQALYQLNSLRNRLAHELEPKRTKIDGYMRDISQSLLGETTGHLNRDFYGAAMLLLGYLGIAREPGTFGDME